MGVNRHPQKSQRKEVPERAVAMQKDIKSMKKAFTQLETHFEDEEQSDSSIADSDDDTASVHPLVSQE